MIFAIRPICNPDTPQTEYQKEQAKFAKMQMEFQVWWPRRLWRALFKRAR